MGFHDRLAKTIPLLILLIYLSLANVCLGARKLTSLYQPPPMALTYHKGALLEGNLPVSILWYGEFSPAQKSIIADFLLSLNPRKENLGPYPVKSLVSHWWNTIQTYMKKAGKKGNRIVLANQVTDRNCSLGKILKKSQISRLARRVHLKRGELTLVLTAKDVAVEGFCMSNCGFHSSNAKAKSVFIWVGNSVTQCPVFLAGTVTNPYGNGYFLGSDGAHLEAASACPGVYGKGAYPGYAGELLVDRTTGASYNAQGVNGRKYLLPAMFDPVTSQCSTIV
ncbi:hypothetical protein REPUB_Repub02eG0082500 [Reevesia pubescens]